MWGVGASLFSVEMVLRALSRGGGRWQVTRTTGDGIDAPVVTGVVGIISGWAFRSQPKGVQIGSVEFLAQDTWKFIAHRDADLRSRDRIDSLADPTMHFQVMSVELWEQWRLAILEETP